MMTMDLNLRQLLKLMLIPLVVASPVELLNPSKTQSLDLVRDKTIHARDEPSAYPYGDAAPGEFKYLGWDPKKDDQKKRAEKIHAAFIEWGAMAKLAAKESANHDSAIVKRWFGKQDDPSETEKVFANMWDVKGDKPAAPVGKLVCEQTDFANRCKNTTRAYMVPATGHFHICPAGDNLRLNKDINCDSLDKSVSAKMRSLPMTLLHEMTHADDIGTDGHGGLRIVDEATGAYDCFKLSDDDKGDNAQNYAWFSGDLYWADKCKTTFEDPVEGVADIGEADE